MKYIYEEEKDLLRSIKKMAEDFEKKDGYKISLDHLIWYCSQTIKEIETEEKYIKVE